MTNLAVLYIRTGRYGDAEALMRETLETQRRVLGASHAETLTTLNNLAGLYDELLHPSAAQPRRCRRASSRQSRDTPS
jgi:hypothetical protein